MWRRVLIVNAAVIGSGFAFFKFRSSMGSTKWDDHVVKRHDEFVQLADNFWEVSADLFRSGDRLRNMHVYRLPDGGLLLDSAIAMDENAMDELESLGVPEILLVPHAHHREDALVYKQRFPELIVTCPRDIIPEVSEVVPVDTAAEDVLPQHGVICHKLPATRFSAENVYELLIGDGKKAIMVADGAFNAKPGWFSTLFGIGGTLHPVLPLLYRLIAVKEPKETAAVYAKLATDSQIVLWVFAHGIPIEEDQPGRIHRALIGFANSIYRLGKD